MTRLIRPGHRLRRRSRLRGVQLVSVLLLIAALPGCDTGPRCTAPDGVDPDWMRRLGCERDYQVLWAERDDAVFARTLTINWLIDR